MYCQPVMALPAAISPLDVSRRTVAPGDVIDWHAHWHDELCLVLDGTPIIGHAGSKLIPQDDTLFLFGESEEHGVWNLGGATARLWLLEFRINSDVRTDFRELFDRTPERRVLKLSAGQRHRFCSLCQKLALEKDATGSLSEFAASAWLTLQLVDITRWLSANFEVDLAGLSTIRSRANDFRSESLSRFAPAPLSQTLRNFSAGNVDSPSDGSGQGAIANQQPFGQRDRL